MPARLSRKRYQEIVRYLKSVIDDPKKPDKLRMTAVANLLEVFARSDRTQAQLDGRKARQEAEKGEEGVPGATEETEQVAEPSAPQQTPEEAAREFLKSIAGGGSE